MSKYIDADKISSELQRMIDDLPSSFPLLDRETLVEMERGIQMARQFILNCAETADVKEVKHGKWIKETIGGREGLTCTNCQHRDSQLLKVFNGIWHYCPYCGAEMKQE